MFYIVAVIVLVLDQFSKWLIVENMNINDQHSVIGTFFAITSHRNKGAAFGILQEQRLFFLIITVVIVAGLIWYLHRSIARRRTLLCWALALVLGGAFGNFVDRLLFGEVVDFLQFRFIISFFGKDIDYTYPIFNLADSAIFIGVALIFLDSFLEWREENRSKKGTAYDEDGLGTA